MCAFSFEAKGGVNCLQQLRNGDILFANKHLYKLDVKRGIYYFIINTQDSVKLLQLIGRAEKTFDFSKPITKFIQMTNDNHICISFDDFIICIYDLQSKGNYEFNHVNIMAKILSLIDNIYIGRLHSMEGHRGYVLNLVQLSNGFIASASEDNSIRIWNHRSGEHYDDESY